MTWTRAAPAGGILGAGRDDSALAALVLETYEKLQSHAYPAAWLEQNRAVWEHCGGDFNDTPYAAELLAVVRRKGFIHMTALRRAALATEGGDLYKGYGEKFLTASRSLAPLAASWSWEAARDSPGACRVSPAYHAQGYER